MEGTLVPGFDPMSAKLLEWPGPPSKPYSRVDRKRIDDGPAADDGEPTAT
jgi:hypothetical protein